MTSPLSQPDGASRDTLLGAILAFLGRQPDALHGGMRAALEREIDRAGPAAVAALQARLGADDGWTYYPPDPLARRIHDVLADDFLDRDSGVLGTEHLDALPTAPIVICANHLSYADANVVEILLRRCGRASLAGRLTAIAGPKVFTSRERRFSSLCFGTVKVPQSVDVSSGEAVLNAREVAAAARRSIDAARARLAQGDVLLLFGEGTRSRAAAMQPMLPGVARYLDVPGTRVLPAGITGSERLFRIEDATLHRAPVTVRFGPALDAGVLVQHAGGDRRAVVDAIGRAIADLLPDRYRGVYGPRRARDD